MKTADPKDPKDSEAQRVQQILHRGHTVDQLSSEDLRLVVKHIDIQQQQQQKQKEKQQEKEAPAADHDPASKNTQKPEESKEEENAKETKDERRKRLHARNMRYYRSLESDLIAFYRDARACSCN